MARSLASWTNRSSDRAPALAQCPITRTTGAICGYRLRRGACLNRPLRLAFGVRIRWLLILHTREAQVRNPPRPSQKKPAPAGLSVALFGPVPSWRQRAVEARETPHRSPDRRTANRRPAHASSVHSPWGRRGRPRARIPSAIPSRSTRGSSVPANSSTRPAWRSRRRPSRHGCCRAGPCSHARTARVADGWVGRPPLALTLATRGGRMLQRP